MTIGNFKSPNTNDNKLSNNPSIILYHKKKVQYKDVSEYTNSTTQILLQTSCNPTLAISASALFDAAPVFFGGGL
jgi:hypothetical protein